MALYTVHASKHQIFRFSCFIHKDSGLFFPLLYACDIPENSLCPRTSNRDFVDDMWREKRTPAFTRQISFLYYLSNFYIIILMWVSLDPSLVWLEFVL